MENREFISAANLPTTEASEVDVLCVENGELKRKPAANLGGGVSWIDATDWTWCDDWNGTGMSGYDLTGIMTYDELKGLVLKGAVGLYWNWTSDFGTPGTSYSLQTERWEMYDDLKFAYGYEWDSYYFFADTDVDGILSAMASAVSTMSLDDEDEQTSPSFTGSRYPNRN